MKKPLDIQKIAHSICLIRGKKIMLDRTLAELYGVETRVLNQAVRRNLKRFPADFMFPLIREEIMDLSQSVISPAINKGGTLFPRRTDMPRRQAGPPLAEKFNLGKCPFIHVS